MRPRIPVRLTRCSFLCQHQKHHPGKLGQSHPRRALDDDDELSPDACAPFDLSTTLHANPAFGDNTNDDDGDGVPALPLGTDASDDGPSWDTDADGWLDGYECATAHNPRDRFNKPSIITPISTLDTDGDGLRDEWEERRIGTDPFSRDSDGDGLGDCKEHADLDGNGLVNSTGDFILMANAVLYGAPRTVDFDVDRNGTINSTGDFVAMAGWTVQGKPCL